jgi:hypothetical protein
MPGGASLFRSIIPSSILLQDQPKIHRRRAFAAAILSLITDRHAMKSRALISAIAEIPHRMPLPEK